MATRARFTIVALERLAPKVKTGLAVVGVCVIAIVVAELLARAVLAIDDSFEGTSVNVSPTGNGNGQGSSDEYGLEELLDRSQTSADNLSYQPYTIWSQKSVAGLLVNIDGQGLRITHNNSSEEDPIQVWMFGGSTMWGWGASDAHTIPSEVADLFNNDWRVDAQITNFGEIAYVSTQEVISLLRELQSGGRPDVVVFYDGANDSFTARTWPDVPGAHLELDIVRAKLESDDDEPTQSDGGLSDDLRSLGLYRIANFAARKLGLEAESGSLNVSDGSAGGGFGKGGELTIDEIKGLAFDVWRGSQRVSKALAAEYGFSQSWFLQPMLKREWKILAVPEEEILAEALESPSRLTIDVLSGMSRLLAADLAEGDGQGGVHDLSHVFESVAEQVYFDVVHINERGNRLVAESIFEIVKGDICRNTPLNASKRIIDQLSVACN